VIQIVSYNNVHYIEQVCIMKVQEIVVSIRKSTQLTQQEFGNLTNLHRSSVSFFERGLRIPPPHHAKKYLVISQKFNLGFKLEDFYQD